MVRRVIFLSLAILSPALAFVPLPASPRACFPWRTRSRGETTAHLLVSASGGDAIVSNVAALTSTTLDAAPSIPNAVVGDLAGGGMSPFLLATAAPGDTYLATGLFGIAAAAIAVGTGILVLSTVSGKDGLGAFLSQEKGNNPFYKDTMDKVMPKTPEVFNKIRFPDLDFVEVYNQPPRAEEFEEDGESDFDSEIMGGVQDESVAATAESLRQRLLEAVEAKDYDLASSLERELANFMRKNGMNFEDDGK